MDPVTPGTLVAERYRLIREIGLGGMGSVWLAYDEALASRCAIKLLHAEPARQEELSIRLECEAKCGAQLRSPHVVDVLNRGQWQGRPFIVMEYLEGEDLAERLDRVGRLDATTTYRIVSHVARALTRAHGLGIIHRDVKPANIFLVPGEEDEIAKVLDFGIAKHGALPNAFENPQEASFIGTPCYMSPEQARGQAADYRCDLWALAMITFECLTGSLPFSDDSVPHVLATILGGSFPAITATHRELPEALEAWWRRATQPDINQRFQSAKEFADALGEALAAPKMPISRPERAIAEAATAATVLAPPELTPSRRAPAHAPHAANLASRNAAVTLHAHSAPARRESLRVPMRSRRGLALVGGAVCAVLGFGASTLNAKLDSTGLYRAMYAAATERDEAPAPAVAAIPAPASVTAAASIPVVEAAPEPPPAEAKVALRRPAPPPARFRSETIPTSVAIPAVEVRAIEGNATNTGLAARLQTVRTTLEVEPRHEPAEPTVIAVSEAEREDPGVADSREPIAVPPPLVAPAASDDRANDALPERIKPPGEKDYGI